MNMNKFDKKFSLLFISFEVQTYRKNITLQLVPFDLKLLMQNSSNTMQYNPSSSIETDTFFIKCKNSTK